MKPGVCYATSMTLMHLFGIVAIVVLLYMTAWFGLARALQRADAVDSAWGLGFVAVAWTALVAAGNHHMAAVLAALFVTVWGVRLCFHITKRNVRKPEDYRYQAYREKWGKRFWLQAYVRIFLVQGILLSLISLPVIAVMHRGTNLTVVAIAGFVVWAAGIVCESLGDYQLQQFLKTRKKGEIMQRGLWKYSRHPNYFGEVTAWWGAAIVAVAYRQWWGVLGALVITVLITKVSGIPPLEKHYEGNAAYQEYAKRTSVLVPLPPRK